MNKNINTLTILRNLLDDKIFSLFIRAAEKLDELSIYEFLYEALRENAETDFIKYVCNAILYDKNAFSEACAAGREISPYMRNAYIRDLNITFGFISEFNNVVPELLNMGEPAEMFTGNTDEIYLRLEKFYRNNGCGTFIKYRAFSYDGGKLIPVKNPSDITLEELKGYVREKAAIDGNIYNFLHGLPYGNMLLYGDRGTGKSSTIHAMLNRYWHDGLRIVELNKHNMLELPKIRQMLLDNPLKFIIFIDDLSLDESDKKISGLKAALEGSVAGNTLNTMIVATSNRRHIIKENFSDRDNSVHVSDSMQEQLSLSDRFGITILFSSTDKAQYLEIVKGIAADAGLQCDEKLLALAERWALVKGGRSPRRARQFVDLAVSCKERNTEIDF